MANNFNCANMIVHQMTFVFRKEKTESAILRHLTITCKQHTEKKKQNSKMLNLFWNLLFNISSDQRAK